MKKIALTGVPNGGRFTFGGVEFVKLDGAEDRCFVLTADVVQKNVPFEHEDAEREDHNNYVGSHIGKFLGEWLECNEDLDEAALPYDIDLTTMDGMKDYGTPTVRVGLLTIDEYRKYREHIPLASDWWWLATGWTTASSPYSNAFNAYYVNTGGTLGSLDVYGAYFAARPALYLKSSILVSVEGDDEEELTPEQKEMALYEGAVEKFGKRAQMLVAIEEMSELTKALLKYVRYEDFGQGDEESILNSIAEERADVAIMLSQLEVIFGDNAEVEWQKLEHLEKLVKGDV